MARPTPKDNQRRALFGWLTDKEIAKWAPATASDLPIEIQALIAYRASETEDGQALIAGDIEGVTLGLAGGCCARPEGLDGVGSQDGPTSVADELEHAAAARCV